MRTVLIANRGEIAVRVARACTEAGLRSVAVYADADADAVHVRAADEARALGGAGAKAYLDADAVLRAAAASGADAVHPGYGFLSESADFAQAVIDADLTWIGPPPEAMRLLGDKVSARRIAAEVGAPMAPGTTSPVTGADEVHAFADEHGFPVAIKAAFGGGGRGLRVARSHDEIGPALSSAVSEAVSAFGRGECFVERWLDAPRHVEVQVLADAQRVVVVGTRDCSTQRRNQKLIEEAPAPFLTESQDHELREGARAICARAGYTGVGTVEFLLGADGTLSFLEVNTRLQVEHTVSEETSGIDLVRAQLTVAAGGALPPSLAEDPPARGHAIEVRINAEDPGRGFLPATGTITRWRVPGGPGVRVDSGVEEGSVVGPAFDSLLAKLVVVGEDRDHAIARLRRALGEMVVEGVPTVLGACVEVVEDEAFTAPDGVLGVYTGWVEEHLAARLVPQDLPAAEGELAAERVGLRRVAVEIDGRRVVLGLPRDLALGAGADGGGDDRQPDDASDLAEEDPAVLASPSAGSLVAWLVEDGEHVEEGAGVASLEAMKMETTVVAHRSGRLVRGDVEVGSVVAAGAALARIEEGPASTP